MIRLSTLSVLIALTIPGIAAAEVRPRAGSHDGRVTYASFQEGQVYTIHTRVRNVTLVELGDGETIRTISVGDSESFEAEKLGASNAFSIMSFVSGASTNMTVETNRHFYFLNVVESSRVTPNWSVKITVPGRGGSRAGSAAAAAAIPPEVPMHYRTLNRSRAAEFAPVGMSDDGKRTVIQIPSGAPIPSVFRADASGLEYSVNSSVNGTFITVGALSERWVLRYGDEYVCIEGIKAGAERRKRRG